MVNFEKFYTMTPMKYYDCGGDFTKPKAIAMLTNEGKNYIATKKNDGEWCRIIKDANGKITAQSRSISKVTGEYGDKTEHIPHIVEELASYPRETVLIGELCFEDITKEGAECIYTGMMTDTGGFTYNSNNREIYLIIGELLSKGVDKDEIYRKVFNTHSEGRLRLMGYVLYEKMQVVPAYRSALITLTREEQGRFQYAKGDTEGFVNIPLSMKDVDFSVFLREDTEKDMIKVSLRSVGDFPCNKVAAEFFNGGGHLNASGGEFYGPMEEAVELFKQALAKYENLLLTKKQLFQYNSLKRKVKLADDLLLLSLNLMYVK